MSKPVPGNLIDIPIDEIEISGEKIKVIMRLRVLKYDADRDMYLMQGVDVYQERRGAHENRKEP